MTDTDRCPHCDTDLTGSPIPVEHRDSHYGGSTHYSRTVGIEVRGVYDGVLFWTCPDCGLAWHRWQPGSHIRDRAEPYVQQWNDDPPKHRHETPQADEPAAPRVTPPDPRHEEKP